MCNNIVHNLGYRGYRGIMSIINYGNQNGTCMLVHMCIVNSIVFRLTVGHMISFTYATGHALCYYNTEKDQFVCCLQCSFMSHILKT